MGDGMTIIWATNDRMGLSGVIGATAGFRKEMIFY